MTAYALPGGSDVIHLSRLECANIAVTGVALSSRGNVIDRLSDGAHVVVTIGTTTCNRRHDRCMVRLCRRRPGRGRFMAAVALGCGHHVRGWFRLRVLRCHRPVMAGGTVAGGDRADCIGMHRADADGHWRKRHAGSVAGVARCRSRHVRGRFAGGTNSVMARCARTRDYQCVAITGRQPCGGFMARIACQTRRQMRRGFACRIRAIMAVTAGGYQDALGNAVLKSAGRPARCSVT